MKRLAGALLLLTLCVAGAGAHPPAGHLAIRAGRCFDGVRWHDGATVVLHGNAIQELRLDGSVPAGVSVLDAPDAVLTPGLIDLDSALGLAGGRDEWHEALSPDLRIVDAFAPAPEELAAFRASGVTSAWLAPGPSGVLGGRGAVVQPGAPGRSASVLVADWGAVGSLAAKARQGEREPTSLPHQAEMLERSLAPGFAGPPRVRIDDAASAARAARLSGVLLVGRPEEDAALRELDSVRGLVFSGVAPGHGDGVLEAPARVHREGLAIGFGSARPGRDAGSIRIAAARAVQGGLDPTAALSALTGSAAGLARLPGARGTITRGAIADVVLWTGDPVEPASRALRTWVGGLEVHHGE